jgi:hypothetical protein
MEKAMLPTTRSRVPMHTSKADNAAIKRGLSNSLDYYAHNTSQIEARLRQLDREWDIERAIELNASALAFAGIVAGVFHDRRWLVLPATSTPCAPCLASRSSPVMRLRFGMTMCRTLTHSLAV